MTALNQELLASLQPYVARLNALSEPLPSATVFYEVMSGGLVWSDEVIRDVPTPVIWALRPLFAYRTSLILGTPQVKWSSYWNACFAMFPSWIGFRPERSVATPELLRVLKKGEKRLDRCLKES